MIKILHKLILRFLLQSANLPEKCFFFRIQYLLLSKPVNIFNVYLNDRCFIL